MSDPGIHPGNVFCPWCCQHPRPNLSLEGLKIHRPQEGFEPSSSSFWARHQPQPSLRSLKLLAMWSCCWASPRLASVEVLGVREGGCGAGVAATLSLQCCGAGLTRSRFAGFTSAPEMRTVLCLTTAKHSNGTAALAPVQREKNNKKST